MSAWWWSWLLTAVGVTGFVLAGRRVWWCWYVNLGCQGLWVTYAIVTRQFGFIVASGVYTIVFLQNAIRWTREHYQVSQVCKVGRMGAWRRSGGPAGAPEGAATSSASAPTPPASTADGGARRA